MGTSPIALVRSLVLAPVATFLERERLPYEGLFEALMLSRRPQERPDDFILLGQASVLLERIARTTCVEDIGLLAANTIKFDAFGRLRDMVDEAETLFDTLHRLVSRAAAFSTGERLSLQWQGERLLFSHRFALRPFPGIHHADSFSLVVMIKVVQHALDSEWKPDLIVMPDHERMRKRQYEAFFKTNISFKGDAWAISIPTSRLADRIPETSVAVRPGTQRVGESLPMPSAPDITRSLGELIRSSLPLNHPTIDCAARLAGVSVSTLKRRLREAGLTYSDLIETERLRLSLELLAQDGIQICDVASELGYTEPGNFSRAFRAWTGLTPSKFRALQSKRAAVFE